MLPAPDKKTMSRYLLSIAETIHQQVNLGLTGNAPQRLRECATIAARVAQQLERPDDADAPDAPAEHAALAAAEREFAVAEAERAAAGLRPAPPTARQIEAPVLERYLRAHPLGGDALRVRKARLLAGGRCKLTALVSQTGAAELPSSFILRQDWEGGATDTRVAGEYLLLQRLAASGLRVPRPLLNEPETTAVGLPFILLERMPGGIAGSLFTPPLSRSLGLQLAEQMGRLHALPVTEYADCLTADVSDRAALAGALAGFRQMQAEIGLRSRIVDAAIDWLEAHLDDAGTMRCVIHNDLGFHNFLVEGEELTALLDWELASIGHPAADLGYVKPFVGRMLPWAEFMDHYAASGGWRGNARELRFHTIWNAVRLYGLIMQARAAIAAAIVNDVEISFACADNVMLLLDALGAELSA